MTIENQNLKDRLYKALDSMKSLAEQANGTDVEIVEGIVVHINRRSETIKALRNKPGVYLSADEVNDALDSEIEHIPGAVNYNENSI